MILSRVRCEAEGRGKTESGGHRREERVRGDMTRKCGRDNKRTGRDMNRECN